MSNIFDEVHEKANEIVNEVMGDLMRFDRDSRSKSGLDPRALGGECYFGPGVIVTTINGRKSLDYYGGFEYIDEEHIITVGDYVFYSVEADRVAQVLERLGVGHTKVDVYDIVWDSDEEDLVSEVTLSMNQEELANMSEEDINDWISNSLAETYGHLAKSWEYDLDTE